jgi:hypothetical protein
MTLLAALSDAEAEAIWEQVWKEEFAPGKDYSLYRYLFRASHLTAERDLERRGLLDTFRRTQQLPDYPRAQDAIKRGWGNWAYQAAGIDAKAQRKYDSLHQHLLLYGLRRDQSSKARQERRRRSVKLIEYSKAHGDSELLRKLRHVADPSRKHEGYREFIQVLLTNWLPSFWWLMPMKLVAFDMARIDGRADDSETIGKRYQNLRQITTRRVPPSPGVFFSGGYNGVFYSTKPTLVKDVQSNGLPRFHDWAKRLLNLTKES